MIHEQMRLGVLEGDGAELARYPLGGSTRVLRLWGLSGCERLFDEGLEGGAAEQVDGRWRGEALDDFVVAYVATARRLGACPSSAEAFWMLEDESDSGCGSWCGRVTAVAPVWRR